jgi:hypothetical protein
MSQSSPSAPAAAVDAIHPWPGLSTFTEEQRAFFHGRDDEARELTRRIERKTLTVLFGQSGLGKSSLLQAGVFPRLRAAGFCPIYVRLDHAADAPSLAEQIKPSVFAETSLMGTWSQTGSAVAGETLWEFFHHRDDVLRGGGGQVLTPLLVFDQFEELFTLGAAADATRARAQAFLTQLADLVENRPPASFEARLDAGTVDAEKFDFARSDYRVLIALREDYLPHLESLKGAMPALMQNRLRLTRLSGAQALEAVVKPAPGLVPEEVARAIVAFVAGRTDLAQAEVEPALLSLVCRELNHRRLTAGAATIDAALLDGSRETILVEFYERALADQPPAVRHFVEDELLTDSGYRENIALERAQKILGAAASALDVLVARRLLRIEERLDVRRIELTHDVLCGVVKSSREVRLTREARENAERQLAETRAKEAAAARALWRARVVATVCGVLALGAAGSAVFGYFNLQRARSAESAAVAAGKQALEAKALAETAQASAESARGQAEELLGFVLNDLQEQLTAFGQTRILLELNEQAVTYYEKLGAAAQTPATRAGYARALASLGDSLGGQGDLKSGGFNLEKALQIYEMLAQAGPLPVAVRIDYATTFTSLSRNRANTTSFQEAEKFAARAVEILKPLVNDPVLGGVALRRLAEANERRSFSLLRFGRYADSVVGYNAALAAANASDQRLPSPRRPGLRAASILPWLGEALASSNRLEEGIAANTEGRDRLREFLAREPYLVSARRQLAYASSNAARIAEARWDFAAAEAAGREAQDCYEQILKLDPDNTSALNNLSLVHGGRARMADRRRDFAAAEKNLVLGLAILDRPNGNNFMKYNQLYGAGKLARLAVRQGREADAVRALSQVRSLTAEVNVSLPAESYDRAASDAQARTLTAEVDYERGNLTAVRTQMAANVQALAPFAAANEQARDALGDAHLTAAQAAWAQGDGAAAEKAFAAFLSLRRPPSDKPLITDRYGEIDLQLWHVRILAAAGRRDEARALIAKLKPEITAVCGAAPDEAFTQFTRGSALGIEAQIDDTLTPAARRTLLNQSLALLRPLAAAGRLTPSERRTDLARVEAALAQLDGK